MDIITARRILDARHERLDRAPTAEETAREEKFKRLGARLLSLANLGMQDIEIFAELERARLPTLKLSAYFRGDGRTNGDMALELDAKFLCKKLNPVMPLVCLSSVWIDAGTHRSTPTNRVHSGELHDIPEETDRKLSGIETAIGEVVTADPNILQQLVANLDEGL